MTTDDIIRMAREAGFAGGGCAALFRFAALVAAAEREACAHVAESLGPIDYPITAALYRGNVADAIRARSKE